LAADEHEKRSGGPAYWQLIVWQKGMAMARSIYALAPRLPHEEINGMRSQITRAAVSVPTNVAEVGRGSHVPKRRNSCLSRKARWQRWKRCSRSASKSAGSRPGKQRTRAMMLEIGRMLTSMRRNVRRAREGK